jgi:alpha-beta hydrolase superfamily lysophospholipase
MHTIDDSAMQAGTPQQRRGGGLALAIAAALGAAAVLLGAHWIRRAELPRQDYTLETIELRDAGAGVGTSGRTATRCAVPMTVLDPPAGETPVGTAVVLHGLAANRRVMLYLGQDFAGHGMRAYLLDLPGHGDSREAFSFARAEICATAVVETLERNHAIDPKTTVLIGHSMGAAIAVRMADREPMAATIAISPAPMVLPQRMPANLLVLAGQFDIGAVKRQAQILAGAAEGSRTRPDDFEQKRAFELDRVPLATHISALANRTVAHRAELWAMQALLPSVDAKTLALNLDLATYDTFSYGRRRLAGAAIGLAGLLVLLWTGVVAVARLAKRMDAFAATPQHPGRVLVLAEGALCALVGVLILRLGVPLAFLHLYGGAYLASLVLVFGLFLLALNWDYARQNLSVRLPEANPLQANVLPTNALELIAAVALGFAAMLAIGAWLNWEAADMWLNAPRWLRFAGLLPIAWIFSFAEEVALGPVPHAAKASRAARYATALALRGELWLACLLAYYELASHELVILLLGAVFAIFSVLQRLVADQLRASTSAAATALFDAILAAWLIAAAFPLT